MTTGSNVAVSLFPVGLSNTETETSISKQYFMVLKAAVMNVEYRPYILFDAKVRK
jgi:hypothetical protein